MKAKKRALTHAEGAERRERMLRGWFGLRWRTNPAEEGVVMPPRRFLGLVQVLFAVIVGCTGNDEAASGLASGSTTAASLSARTSAPSPGTVGGPHRYEGPSVAFDVPEAWHEFYLKVPFEFFAAYGPIQGGGTDYVAVAPVPPDLAGLSRDQALASLVPPAERIGPVRNIDMDGFSGFSVSARVGVGLAGEVTILHGRNGDYLIACQSSEDMRDEVQRGCASIRTSLVEAAPSPVTDASGCTDRELSLLRGVDLPDGSSPREPRVSGSETDRLCDLWVEVPPGYRDSVITILSERLRDEGWHTNPARLDRTLGNFDVWQMIADRDFDLYLIEAYVDDGVTDHFFITVYDG
jgi:hypothetical protein